jgi:hypothetical protein
LPQKIRHQIGDELAATPVITMTALKERIENITQGRHRSVDAWLMRNSTGWTYAAVNAISGPTRLHTQASVFVVYTENRIQV